MPTHHRSTSSSSISQVAHSFFMRLSNGSAPSATTTFGPSPMSYPPQSPALSQESLASSPSSSLYSHDSSQASSAQAAHDFFSDPRFTRWIDEGPIRREASAKFRQANESDIRRHYISELRAATIAEYGPELTNHMGDHDTRLSPASAPARSGMGGREAGVTGGGSPASSVYDVVLSLRSQIDAADAAEELSRRRAVHRNFSLFIPAPHTPRKTSIAEQTLGPSSGRSRSGPSHPQIHPTAHCPLPCRSLFSWSDVDGGCKKQFDLTLAANHNNNHIIRVLAYPDHALAFPPLLPLFDYYKFRLCPSRKPRGHHITSLARRLQRFANLYCRNFCYREYFDWCCRYCLHSANVAVSLPLLATGPRE